MLIYQIANVSNNNSIDYVNIQLCIIIKKTWKENIIKIKKRKQKKAYIFQTVLFQRHA